SETFPIDQPYLAFPYKAVYRLGIRVGSLISFCSGAAVSQFHILTAAHCVDTGSKPNEIWVFPAQTDIVHPLQTDAPAQAYGREDLPFGVAKGVSVFTYSQWAADRTDTKYDVAWITLDRRIGAYTGSFGVDSVSSAPAPGAANTSGYPGGNNK